MKLTNQKIYDTAIALSSFSIDGKLPVKISFFLQKNIRVLTAAAEEIEAARLKVAQDFGELNDDGTQYVVPPERLLAARMELADLFNLEQDLNIHIFKLNDFDDIELTYQQLSAIMFMIEE